MRIAIDAMGGDHAPDAVVAGALLAAREYPDTELILVGDAARIEQLIAAGGGKPANVQIRHASEVIEADDEPVKAVRRKKDASMVVAGRMVKEREADAMLSAGNTGALMAVGLLVVGRLPGIHRPALAPLIPTLQGNGVLALDLGANMDASPEHLAQYALMGTIYRDKVHKLSEPRVGLLNVGTEPMKGNELTKQAFGLLEQLPIRFVGNVEARDILNGVCDVIVCDGFAGNIMLKSLEGTQKAIFTLLKQQLTSSMLGKIAGLILKPKLKVFKQYDYREHGGAPLLGIDGVVIKSHGSSDAGAIKNAVGQARLALVNHLTDAIRMEINRNEEQK
jgi:glycerol-3-phosphate acyltransferase PlsX